MSTRFSAKTFSYFDLAKKNEKNPKWPEKNRVLYEEEVRAPFSVLIHQLDLELSDRLPRIKFDPKKITRPPRLANKLRPGEGVIKTHNHTHATLSKKNTSGFEWNPGYHIQFGEKEDEILSVPGFT
jgi:uncharacterized protein (DUF2461 family)